MLTPMRSLVWFAVGLLLLAASASPAQAARPECVPHCGTGHGGDQGPGGNETGEPEGDPEPAQPGGADCELVDVSLGSPRVSWSPLLGLITVDPDDCYTFVANGALLFTYHPRNVSDLELIGANTMRESENGPDSDCELVDIAFGPPSVSWSPILGILTVDPDDCYNIYDPFGFVGSAYPGDHKNDP